LRRVRRRRRGECARDHANAQCAEARFSPKRCRHRCWSRIARKPALLNFDGETRTVSYLSCAAARFRQAAASFSTIRRLHEIDAARHRAVARRSDAPWRHDRPGEKATASRPSGIIDPRAKLSCTMPTSASEIDCAVANRWHWAI